MELNSLEDLNKVLDYNFKNSLDLEPFHLACPSCAKLYVINPSEIMSTRPKFSCNSCDAQFYINYPEILKQELKVGVVITQHSFNSEPELKKEPLVMEESASLDLKTEIEPSKKIDVKESQWQEKLEKKSQNIDLVQCPKCEFVNSRLSDECIKCSVVFNKKNMNRKGFVKASEELIDLWKLALDNYDTDQNHQNFVRYSHLENNLQFASQKYNSILSINPHDDVANQMKKQIIALSTVSLNKQETVIKPVKSFVGIFNIWTFSIVLSLSIISFGFYFSTYKNLIGVGASALCLILSLRFLNSKN